MKKMTKIVSGLILTIVLSINLLPAKTTTTYYGVAWSTGCYGAFVTCKVVVQE